MNLMTPPGADEQKALMRDLLERQKARVILDGAPSASVREDRLDRCVALLVEHAGALAEAMEADFGARSRDMSLLTDIAASIASLKHARANVRRWMKPERRAPEFPLGLLGAKAEVRFQPKGVVGIVSPWNFPVNLAFSPLAGVFAAGNRAMLKPSEHTPLTAALLRKLIAERFDAEEFGVIVGGPDVGAAFAALPFDHIIFTGGGGVARHVMRAAAENLTPLTLELGGKSPVLLGRTAPLDVAAKRIMVGKTLNAGQVCLAPDYVLAPSERVGAFLEAAASATRALFPTLADNPDYCGIISDRHYGRLQELLQDAREKGATLHSLAADGEIFPPAQRKIPPTLVLGATPVMRVMREEIFGPILPVMGYGAIDEAIDLVNGGERPLALYYFGEDPGERERVLSRTTSGGAVVNDVVVHVAQENLPFGGIGPSGMGAYHGREGFLEFSHRRAVFTQTKSEAIAMVRPPYGDAFRKFVAGRIKK